MKNKQKIRTKFYDLKPWLTFFALLSIFSFSVWGTYTVIKENQVREYTNIVSTYNQSSFRELADKVQRGDTFYIFLGVSTCPDCQDFAKRLDASLKSKGISPREVYYVGFENLDEVLALSEGEFDALTKGVEGVPVFRKVIKGVITPVFNDLSDLGEYLVSS